MKRYYTLIARENKSMPWAPQFGDYEREVVEQEQQDVGDEWTFTRVICTKPDQASIDAAVAKLNGNLAVLS